MTREIPINPQPPLEITEICEDDGIWYAYIKQKYGQEYEIDCPFITGDILRQQDTIISIVASKINNLWYWIITTKEQ